MKLTAHNQGYKQGRRAGANRILASQAGTVLTGRDKDTEALSLASCGLCLLRSGPRGAVLDGLVQ